MPHLFDHGRFVLHSGRESDWKVDCDALADHDWAALAVIAADRLPPFGSVEGVPAGGLKLAAALEPFSTGAPGPVLIVDDVLTTGRSMEEQRAGRAAVGFVLFARGEPPPWVRAMWLLTL
jgi:orotate phosphoribosyltransferase